MAQRPGSYTTFAVMNFVVGGILLLCSVCSGIHLTVTINNQDATQRMIDFLNQQVPGYSAMKIGGAIAGFLFAAMLIAGGIGLLQDRNWGRILSILFAILSVFHHGFLIIAQLFWINPALDRFFAGPFPINLSFGPKMVAMGFMIFWFLAIVYYLIQTIVLAITAPGSGPGDDDDDDDRPRSRRDRDDDDDDRPRRRRSRDDYDDDDDRPRRRR